MALRTSKCFHICWYSCGLLTNKEKIIVQIIIELFKYSVNSGAEWHLSHEMLKSFLVFLVNLTIQEWKLLKHIADSRLNKSYEYSTTLSHVDNHLFPWQGDFSCHWRGCEQVFSHQSELGRHVQSAHLRPSRSSLPGFRGRELGFAGFNRLSHPYDRDMYSF